MQKAAIIDKHAETVRKRLATIINNGWVDVSFTEDIRVEFLPAEGPGLWDEVLTVARGRHVLGSYEYGDTNLFEWTDGKVRAAIIEELADAVVYQAWLEERAQTQTPYTGAVKLTQDEYQQLREDWVKQHGKND